jgi:hypothetical protein
LASINYHISISFLDSSMRSINLHNAIWNTENKEKWKSCVKYDTLRYCFQLLLVKLSKTTFGESYKQMIWIPAIIIFTYHFLNLWTKSINILTRNVSPTPNLLGSKRLGCCCCCCCCCCNGWQLNTDCVRHQSFIFWSNHQSFIW